MALPSQVQDRFSQWLPATRRRPSKEFTQVVGGSESGQVSWIRTTKQGTIVWCGGTPGHPPDGLDGGPRRRGGDLPRGPGRVFLAGFSMGGWRTPRATGADRPIGDPVRPLGPGLPRPRVPRLLQGRRHVRDASRIATARSRKPSASWRRSARREHTWSSSRRPEASGVDEHAADPRAVAVLGSAVQQQHPAVRGEAGAGGAGQARPAIASRRNAASVWRGRRHWRVARACRMLTAGRTPCDGKPLGVPGRERTALAAERKPC